MNKALGITLAASLLGTAAFAQNKTVTIASWGGSGNVPKNVETLI
jgi:putative spermidine/putrescine transport system substrate-binding protein